MQIADLLGRWRAAGATPVHEQRLLRAWAAGLPLDAHARAGHRQLPRALRAALPEFEDALAAMARVHSRHAGSDGERLLVALADGRSVESVLLPRGGLCVSTQVGCAVGCSFCMTGRGGLERQLGSAEIVAQVALARRLRAVTKVVLMGMGEPAHNLDAVLAAIELLGTAGGIGHKSLVFSTVGDLRAFERLPLARVRPALALSLHTTKAALRARLLPRAPPIAPAELVRRALDYADATGYALQVQWTLIEGVNDGGDEIDGLAAWLAGRRAVLNLIPFNPIDASPFRRPPWEQAAAMARALHRRGVLAKLRRSAAQEVDGACGQLRARRLAAAPG